MLQKLALVRAAWELTRPNSRPLASRYWEALNYVISVPKPVRYRPPFYVAKKSGRRRLIVPAEEELLFIQGILAGWIVQEFPSSDDYCYSGQGVLGAVKKHQGSRFAIVFDLKDAFDHITSKKITHWLRFYKHEVDKVVIGFIVDLLTFRGRAPQGCVSTPYVYNLVVRPLDQLLKLACDQFGLSAITRYSDNICFSSSSVFDFDSLEAQVRRCIRGNGFEISWFRRFADEPIIYLGTQIYQGQLSLEEEKYGEFHYRLLEAVKSPTPEVYRAQVTGIFNWAHHICGENIPEDLLGLLVRYFSKVGRTPKSLAEILA